MMPTPRPCPLPSFHHRFISGFLLSSSPELLSEDASIDLLKACKWMPHIKQIHAQLFTHGLHRRTPILHKLIASASAADQTHAEKVFAGIHRPTLFIYNVMIKVRTRSGSWRAALDLFDELRARGLRPDNYTYPYALKAAGSLGAILEGERIHGFALKSGDSYDCYVCNSMLDMYGEYGAVDRLRKVFDEMPLRDLISWNVFISGLVKGNRFESALDVYRRMQIEAGMLPDEATVVSTLSACTALQSLDIGQEIHDYVNHQLGFTTRIQNALLDMYAKCGCLDIAREIFDSILDKNLVCWTSMVSGYANCGRLDEARALFERSPERDPVLWTVMIHGYVQFSDVNEAMALFRQMQMEGVKPDKYSLVALLTGCTQVNGLDQGRWIHSFLEENRIAIDAVIGTALIQMYAKCGCLDDSLRIFNRMSHRDTASWTSIICALAMNGNTAEALKLFSEMIQSGTRPDDITFIGVLTACSHAGLVDEGRQHFASMVQVYRIVPKLEHYGCLIDLFGRSGQLDEAEELIMKIPCKDTEIVVPIYGALLSACRSYENVEMAERVAKRIADITTGDSSSHTLLANIYAAASRWEDARRLRKKMSTKRHRKLPGCSTVEEQLG